MSAFDGFPCLVNGKADAQVICVDPALEHSNVELLTGAYVERLETNPSGRVVTKVIVSNTGNVLLWWFFFLCRLLRSVTYTSKEERKVAIAQIRDREAIYDALKAFLGTGRWRCPGSRPSRCRGSRGTEGDEIRDRGLCPRLRPRFRLSSKSSTISR